MELKIHKIHDDYFTLIGDFQCGIEGKPMEDFLKCEALDCDKNGEGNTFLIFEENSKVVGYYTIKCNAIQVEKDNICKVYPAVEIARLAVDYNYQRKGYGSVIFNHVLESVHELKQEVGIKYIMLFSVPSAVDFYKKFEFLEFPRGINILPSWEIDGCQGMYAVLE